ncbi:MAG: hypothetical protein GY938_05300, partial [Ketobacter sp.]|nr:hypothetical protein [Ketobacter sp.]
AGNILSTKNSANNQQNGSGNVSAGNRLAFHGDRHFTYDERGNLTEERRGTGGKLSTKYTYNSQNQLIKVEKDNQVFEYAYDPLGRRIRKKDAFGETEFLYNGDVLLSEKRNHQEKLYLFEPNSFKPLCFIENNQAYFYHNDHLGTPQEITTWEGQVVWSARYKVYGNVVRKDVEQVENNLRAPGQYYDQESGLHYSRFRYYDPGTGQFTQQDPIGLLGGDNCYRFAPNPINWTDPLGLVCKERYERYKALRDQGYSVKDSTNLSRNKPRSNTWNEFQQQHKGQFENPVEASKAYKDLKDNESPWPYGYDPNSNVRTMNPGETFNMIVDNGKENMPGRFGTVDDIPNVNYGRQNLAIKEEWKPTLDNVVTYRVKKPFDVYEGPVGPQIDGSTYLEGGGSQITFKDSGVWENARPNKYNKNTTDPYLEIVDVKPLKP